MIDATFHMIDGSIVKKKIAEYIWELGEKNGFWDNNGQVCVLKDHKMVKI